MKLSKKRFYYIASPYSSPSATERYERFAAVEEFTARLLAGGYCVYSPIVYNHAMAIEYGLPTDWEFWAKVDMRFLSLCDACIVLQYPGWDKSRGVQAEIRYCKRRKIPLIFVGPPPKR